jgi:hypothetical protein
LSISNHAQANAGNAPFPPLKKPYAQNHVMWMSQWTTLRNAWLPAAMVPGNTYSHLQQQQELSRKLLLQTVRYMPILNTKLPMFPHSESADRPLTLKIRSGSAPLFSQRCRSKRPRKTIVGNASYLPPLPTRSCYRKG